MKIDESVSSTRAINAGINFEAKANLTHKNKYLYTHSVYKGAREPLQITCHTHGDFLQRPNDHLNGSGCPKCSTLQRNMLLRKTTATFVANAMRVHGNTYTYKNTNYSSAKTPVTIRCSIHGDFQQKPSHHLQGAGCTKCANIQVAAKTTAQNRARMNTKSFIQLSKNRYPNWYLYEKTTYTEWSKQVIVTCKIHGDFTTRAGSHLYGLGGCKECARKHMGNGRTFFKGKRTILYVLRLPNNLFKLGITTKSIEHRYKDEGLSELDIIFAVSFFDGVDAFNIELMTKRALRSFGFSSYRVFKHTGNTEVFTCDVIPTLQSIIKEHNVTQK